MSSRSTDGGLRGAEAVASAAPVIVDPPLLAPAGGALAQTEDEPSIDDPWSRKQLDNLWQAIVKDDPELARQVVRRAPARIPLMRLC